MTFARWFDPLRGRWSREEGQTMVEYGVVLTVIAMGCILAFTSLAQAIANEITGAAGTFG